MAVAVLGGGSAVAQTAREALERDFPGVAVLERGERVQAVFGRPMTRSASARAAMEQWMDLYQPVFGVGDLEWVETRGAEISGGRIAFALRQELTIDGGILSEPTAIPVEGGRLRVLVAPDGEDFAVTYVAARVADTDAGIAAPQVTGAQAIAAAGEDERTRHLKVWGEPQLVIVDMDLGTGLEVFAAWRLVGMEAEGAVDTTWVVHIDAVTAELVSARPEVTGSDAVTGVVNGGVTAGFGPPLPASTTEVGLPGATVCIVGEGCTKTAVSGSYQLETTSSAVDVKASLDSGYWYVVEQSASTPVSMSISAIPPASGVDFNFNPVDTSTIPTTPETQADTAPVNIFLNLEVSNAFFATRSGNWNTTLGELPVIKARANYAAGLCSSCSGGMFTAPSTISLCSDRTTCNNGAYTTVISHEYGHYIAYHILEETSGYDAFHEGYADSLAMLVHDTPQIGLDYYSPGHGMRTPSEWDFTYPACSGTKYGRGSVLARLWWDIRLGVILGLPAARQLFVDWTLLSNGAAASQCDPSFQQAADQVTLIEVLIADDDNNTMSDGTPNDEVICAAFADRNIDTQFVGTPCSLPLHGRGRSRADLDESGLLDFFDCITFQTLFAAGSARVDFNGDGLLDTFDFLEFQMEFLRH